MTGLARAATGAVDVLHGLLASIPQGLLQLLARVAIAPTFFRSGQAKMDGLSVTDSTVFLFQHEFGFPAPALFAHVTALAELVLPVLLVVGLATRMSALALIVMTVVIQVVVPQAWNLHILWFALLLYVAARGPGSFSVDHVIASRRRRPA